MSTTTFPTAPAAPRARHSDATRARHRRGFWVLVGAFTVLMAFTTLPTPLYPLYQQLDGFPTVVITLIFAAYGLGVMAGLYLAGHVSDYLGRRRVLLAATAVEVVSAVMFVLLHDTGSLLIARFLCGLGIGAVTATATAHLAELHAIGRPDADGRFAAIVAGAVNTGGLALGPLVAGLLTQWLPHPLTLPYAVWILLLVAAFAALLLLVPETVDRQGPTPAYRPQRVGVEPAVRPHFSAAAVAAAAAFSVLGVFTSLTASFVGGTLGLHSRLLTGALVFGVIGASALSQVVLGTRDVADRLRVGMWAMSVGLGLVAVGAWSASLPVFALSGVVAGAGVGLVFNVAITTAAAISSAEHRGETLAGMFLAAYAGITVPVVAAGVALTWFAAPVVLVVFAGTVLLAVLTSTTRLRRLLAKDPHTA
ncbi:MFS transporter [Humibacillus xanthopallidus]|uniref:Putative MFS family arabinose efflux permease n=1 Tax=Humibacillus xanthopallidus TaxID=412689 RepID=A0A543I1B4_9MICO|nr:MFS transporter [Humibacillus xanthopallidus]TQM64394.1 putative MFS family arabinose efflux permease [Humibacillus xanthopallidus]